MRVRGQDVSTSGGGVPEGGSEVPDAGRVVHDTTRNELEAVLARAGAATRDWARTDAPARARILEAVADALDDDADQLVALAQEETHLPAARLRGELIRATFQLRLFGELLRSGAHLQARVDHADPEWPMGAARPDLRRTMVPLGPALVFAASNFPFAFSVAGGDTASALAAGCPVVLKAHPGHSRLSEATGRVVDRALGLAGVPKGVFAVIHGVETGVAALRDPRVKAAAFTGSIGAGRALFDIACSRPEPIPFYGELGSINPVFVTPGATAERLEELVAGYVQSFTAGAGQFCTKPGLILVPAGSGFTEALSQVALPEGADMLNDNIRSGYLRVLADVAAHPAVSVLAEGSDPRGPRPAPTLLRTTAEALVESHAQIMTECFGPASVVAEYTDEREMIDVARVMQGSLTATIHGNEDEELGELIAVLTEKAGRVLWNGWPTGVSVTYAQQHGGPYPATTAPTMTSVGTAAIERFLRPVAYQDVPHRFLPPELQDGNPAGVPRLVDGEPRTP